MPSGLSPHLLHQVRWTLDRRVTFDVSRTMLLFVAEPYQHIWLVGATVYRTGQYRSVHQRFQFIELLEHWWWTDHRVIVFSFLPVWSREGSPWMVHHGWDATGLHGWGRWWSADPKLIHSECMLNTFAPREMFTDCEHTSHFMSCDIHVCAHVFSRRDQSQRRGLVRGAHDPFITKRKQKKEPGRRGCTLKAVTRAHPLVSHLCRCSQQCKLIRTNQCSIAFAVSANPDHYW